MQVSIKSLSFSYKKNTPLVIDNLSLDIEEGTINVILGLNGCGKTTLIRNIVGLLKPISGSITINGKDINDLKIKDRARLVAYVAQKSSYLDDFLVRDYLTFGFENYLKVLESPTKKHLIQIDHLADQLNITQFLDKTLGELSGGERQVISIAAAILQNTPIILLDEPTSALDIKNQAMVLNLLKEICEKKKKTIILTTHNPNHALKLEANTILMDKGKIINKGNALDIVTPEILKSIYGDLIDYSNNMKYKEVTFK